MQVAKSNEVAIVPGVLEKGVEWLKRYQDEQVQWIKNWGKKDVRQKQHADALSLSRALKIACPKGIDGYFENVGGMVLDAVLPRMNTFGRIAVCGMISGYDGAPIPLANPQLILVSRLKLQGFIVGEHMEDWPAALAELSGLVGSGKLRPRESIAEGLAAAPEAFLGLLKGRNFGKQLVKLA